MKIDDQAGTINLLALPYQDKFFAIEKRLIQGCRSFYADHFSYMV
jgi:hypothetical protein